MSHEPPQAPAGRSASRRFLKPALAVVAVVAVAATLMGLRVSQANKEPEKKKAERTFEFASGDLAELRREPLGRRIPVSGSMRPLLQATVRSKVPAEVAKVHVQEGQAVVAGAPLFTLETADLRARLDAQMAAVAEARARLDLARKNQANNKALLEKSFISQNAYDSVANSVQVAEANLKSAEAQAAIAQRAVADAEIRAPFAGIVSKRWVNQGDKVAADMPVAHVVDLSRMELEAPVPVSEIPFVKVGQEISFEVDGFQGRRFAGRIERVNPAADAGSRSIAVFATLPNSDNSLKGGMFANGTLATASGAEVDVIPTAAIIEEGGQSFVYVVKDGKVERRSVVLGARSVEQGVTTVREGLERGVQVITVKAEGLKPGSKAVVKGAAAPAKSTRPRGGPDMWFTRVSINNPVFATMVMAAFMILGIFSYQRLSVEQMPDVSIPVAVVRTPYPGASAEAVEQEVTRRIEEAINTVSGVRTIRSGSGQGYSWVVAEFELNVDIKTVIQDVRDKVAEARRTFNRDVGEPTVSRADNDNDQPIMYLSMRSDARSLREVSDLAELLVVKRLQGSQGVGNIEVNGSVQRELAIHLKPEMMAAYGVGIDQIVQAIRVENMDAPAGALVSDKAERVVRVQGKLKRPQDFERIIVARRGTSNTSAVTLGQLAEVRDTQREETSLATVNGKRGVSIQIRKTRGANTLEMAQAVRKQIAELKKSLPADVTLEVSFDQSEFIKDSVNNVKTTIIEGALLTILIVFLFLHSWRSTVITGLTLPISVLATFIAMYAFGFTINFITLLALSLSIGVLIDDAIVVRENIVRHLKMGKTHRQAALEATEEIGLAVMATTFTIVAVFVPVAFMGGIIGKFFYQFGVTVVVAVLVSLFVSFTLDPMLSSVWKDPPSPWLQRGPLGWLLGRQQRLMDWLHLKYDGILRWAFDPAHRKLWIPTWSFAERRLRRATIRNRGIVLWIAFFTLVAAFGLLAAGAVKSEFVPRVDEGWTSLRIQTPVGSSLAYTTSKAEQVEAVLREFPDIERVSKSVWKNSSWFEIKLMPRGERKRSQKEIDDALRERLKSVAGLEVNIGWNRPIRIFVQGPDIRELDRISQGVIEKIRAIKGTVDVESSFKPTSPALDVVVNRELASDLGVSMSQIAATTRALIGGEQAGQWEGPDGENHQILVRLPRDERTGIADLDKIYVASYSFNADATPRMVPLRQVAEFKPSLSERQIERRNLQRQIQIWGGLSKGATLGEVGKEVDKILKATTLPPGYGFHQGGDQEMMQESGKYALIALGIAVIFIYLVLASQFGSYLQPLAIMASLPLSLIGVFLALMIFGSTLNIFSVIGFIMLMGLVTKNAILLVDFTNHGIREGKDRYQAILDAGQVRLRPILMTTMAMIFGMLPLALALGAGSEQQSPMAHAVIGGIITSTALTLVVVPVLFTYFDTLGRKVSAKISRPDPVAPLDAVPHQGD